MNNYAPCMKPFHSTLHLGASAEGRVVDSGRGRIVSLAVFFALCYLSLAVRLVDVTMADRPFMDLVQGSIHDLTSAKEETISSVRMMRGEVKIDAEKEWQPNLSQVVMPRQDIRDRNGVLLASSVATRSLYARPQEMANPEKVVETLHKALPDLAAEPLLKRLTSGAKYVQIKRHLTPTEQEKILWAGMPGIYFYDDYYRIYPQGNLFSHVIGYTDIDGKGIAGVERYFDEPLKRDDALRPLNLSLDTRMQGVMHDVLQRTMQEFSANAATGAIFHIPTGEARAMVSLPDFDPNRPLQSTEDARRNRLSVNQYELGSIFKTLSVAMAMQYGGVTFHDGFDASQPISFRGMKISDYHAKKRWLSVPEIMIYSSNIGTVKMVNVVGAERQRSFLTQLGLFRRVGIELNEYVVPRTHAVWKPVESATIAYGQGISITPLHMIRGLISITGGGEFHDLSLIEGEKKIGGRMVSPEVSRNVNRLMRAVVQYGTAKNADVPGYAVGAKTGTATKVINGRYAEGKNISSVIAAFPMPNPEYLVFVMLDEPHGTKATYNFATAGWVAAPAVGEVVRAIAPMAGIPPVYSTPQDEVDNIISAAETRASPHSPYLKQPYVQRTSY